jgi:hypothetical protein
MLWFSIYGITLDTICVTLVRIYHCRVTLLKLVISREFIHISEISISTEIQVVFIPLRALCMLLRKDLWVSRHFGYEEPFDDLSF